MRFNNVLEDIFGHKSKIKVLRYLLNTQLELTGRQLAKIVGIHHRTCHDALKQLASFGIVMMRQSGKAISCKINNNNFLVKEILKPVFESEKNILSQAIKSVFCKSKVKVVSAILFGSVASSNERGTSDIDVLFLISSKSGQRKLEKCLEEKEFDFMQKYGNMLSSLVMTLDEFYMRLKDRDVLISNIIRTGNSVYGKTIQEVLIACQRKR